MLILYIAGGLISQFGWSSIGAFLFGSSGYKEIHNLVKEGDIAGVKSYLEKGGDPNVEGFDGITPLYLAIDAGNFPIVQILVEYEVDVNKKLDDSHFLDFTPVIQAAYKGHYDIVEFLLTNGAEKDIYISAILGEVEAIQRYVEAGRDVNARRSKGTGKPRLGGKTLLHLASWRDSLAAVEFLLEHGAEIDARDDEGYVPLHSAATCNNKNVVQLLIKQGANVNAKNRMREAPLHFAARSGNVEIIEILLANDADIEAQDGFGGDTPLHCAIRGNSIEVVKVLIAHGARLCVQGHMGRTPLGLVKHLGKREQIFQLLIDHGAR
ncbi:MAG: ankyrin repeat domain-containing protein [Spirulinaceae cyanobacterium]